MTTPNPLSRPETWQAGDQVTGDGLVWTRSDVGARWWSNSVVTFQTDESIGRGLTYYGFAVSHLSPRTDAEDGAARCRRLHGLDNGYVMGCDECEAAAPVSPAPVGDMEAAARALAASINGDIWTTESESYRNAWREKVPRVIAEYDVIAAHLSPAPASDAAVEVARRATETTQRYADAIEKISSALAEARPAGIMRAKLVIASLADDDVDLSTAPAPVADREALVLAWDEGRAFGDPHQRRGRPDPADNPYRAGYVKGATS